MRSAEEKDQRIRQLETENKKLLVKVIELEFNVEALTQTEGQIFHFDGEETKVY